MQGDYMLTKNLWEDTETNTARRNIRRETTVKWYIRKAQDITAIRSENNMGIAKMTTYKTNIQPLGEANMDVSEFKELQNNCKGLYNYLQEIQTEADRV